MARKNIIGNRVKLARYNSVPPITQSELAARLQLEGLNIERTVVSKIETGRREVNDVEILALAKTLGVTISWLFGKDE